MKDLSNFLSEKKEDDSPKPLKKGEGADDKAYFALMSEYKKVRRQDPDAAGKLLKQAELLSEKGDVSFKTKLAVAYL